MTPLQALGSATRSIRNVALSTFRALLQPFLALGHSLLASPALRLAGPRRRDLHGTGRGQSLLSSALWRTYGSCRTCDAADARRPDLLGAADHPDRPRPATIALGCLAIAGPARLGSLARLLPCLSAGHQVRQDGPARARLSSCRRRVRRHVVAVPSDASSMSKAPAPDLVQLASLFDSLPAPTPWQPPPPRARPPRPDAQGKAPPKPPSWSAWLTSYLPWGKSAKRPPPRANPFPRLKAGRRSVIVAAVDSGVVQFLRWGETEFGELALIGESKAH